MDGIITVNILTKWSIHVYLILIFFVIVFIIQNLTEG